MNKSEAINELAGALAKAQGAMKHAAKDATNPAFRSRYATLASVIDAVRGVFSINGLSLTQLTVETESGVGVETVLMHTSGQWLSSVTLIPVAKVSAHGIGSALTYARRYGLSAIAGIAADDDDDGNVASQNAPERRSTSVAQTTVEEMRTVVDPSRLLDVLVSIRDSLANDDEHGVHEVWIELDNDLKTVAWTKLDSKERSRIKDIEKRMKELA